MFAPCKRGLIFRPIDERTESRALMSIGDDSPRQPLRQCLFGLLVACTAGLGTMHATIGPAAATSQVQYAKPISNRLNATGRVIQTSVPFKDGKRPLGEIQIRIGVDDTVSIQKAQLLETLIPVVSEASRVRLNALQDSSGFVSLLELTTAGVDIRFDTGLQEVVFRASSDDRRPGEINLGASKTRRVSSNLTRPALFSGYVNVTLGLDHMWAQSPFAGPRSSSDDATLARIELESAVRFWNVVVENRAVYRTGAEANFCPAMIYCFHDNLPDLRRQSSRLIYDRPDESLRVSIGDIDALGFGIQGSPQMVGLSVEKSPKKLNPAENIRPTGQSSFRIDRPSQVEVLVNGIALHRLQLRPGIYNIRDLPLATGANEVQLEITDDTGDKRTQSFRAYSDTSLLAQGSDEWALTAGVPSFLLSDQRVYGEDQYLGSGYYRLGFTDSVTLEAHLQGGNHLAMGGGGAVMQSPWGVFAFRGALSGGMGIGGAAAGDWSLVNFTGISGKRGETVRLSAEYRTPDFHSPGEVATTADGNLHLQPNYRARFDALYSTPLSWGISATLAARYLNMYDSETWYLPYFPQRDRFGADITLSRALGPATSASLTLGYSNESYLVDPMSTADQEPEFRIAARFYFRPDSKTAVTASYDTLNRHADVSAYRSEGNGIGRWDVSVTTNHVEADEKMSAGASASYHGNRADVRVAHNTGLTGAFYNADGIFANQRTSVHIASSMAFADGVLAFGAPIRGNAFAIVHPHASIATKDVTVGNGETVRAVADRFGPGVVSSLAAYQPNTIPVDVEDLPVGYSLGAATFDIYAPYKAGYRLEVGSAYSVYAYGTLTNSDGQPVALLTGIAKPEGGGSKQVSIFTNASGKFGAEGLAPGKWTIEMTTPENATFYAMDIPAGTEGLFKAGVLRPLGPT